MAHLLIPFPFLAVALFTDYRTRRIPNRVTYSLALLGLAIQLQHNAMAGLAGLCGGLLLYALLKCKVRSMRIGGGDMKLLLGCLLFLDLKSAEIFIVLVFVISAFLGMIQYALNHGVGNLVQLLKLDVITAGAAPQEAVHVLGALVIMAAYVLTVSYKVSACL